MKRSIKIFIAAISALLITSSFLLFAKKGNVFVSENQSIYFVKDTSQLIEQLLNSKAEFLPFIKTPKKYEIQIIYTQIDRDENNIPHFRQFSYRLNDAAYFNPASFVKLPTLLVSLEKLNYLRSKGITIDTRVEYDSGYTCQKKLYRDSTATSGFASIGHFIKKALIASDDFSYNRLYEFVGQQPLNERLKQLGYDKTCIIQRFQDCCTKCNRYTNPIRFYNSENSLIYEQPMLVNPNEYHNPLGQVLKGKEHIGINGKLIHQPKDFSFSNNLPLQELHDMLIAGLFPESIDEDRRFVLTTDQTIFLKRYMSMLPCESDIPMFSNKKIFPDNYKKYFLGGNNKEPYIRSFNVNAFSHGYIGDCAYIVDYKNRVEFILAAVIYTNETESIQPKNNQYISLGIPFLNNLGQMCYHYELKRERKYIPDFSDLIKITETN